MRLYFITWGRKKMSPGLLILIAVLFMACVFVRSWSVSAKTLMAPVYHGSEHGKKIALTFNVFWGEEYIPQIIELLKEDNIPVTFFIGGQWAQDFPELTGEIARAGHEVGSHGYSHPHPDGISKSKNLEEIKKAEEILEKVTGSKPVLFAPPYGERGKAVLEAAGEAGYKTILWSIDTIDWQRPDPSVIVSRVVDKAHNGAIVLAHPTAPTVSALPQIIKALKGQGYELVKVSTLLEDLKTEESKETNS